ncbi:putative cytochrome P450 [Pseudomassariella vexata]|uniref:Putative cytochrome P450 n=1 Tax=Pseudomassariella vexata TaxID=1141098 RepID=A0A1Y2DHW9_9PEZI|nr:putative cytochrome P450 [Pseudomassariella vexata]ORY58843.1 putative cytochrome P450 [Pseudomassariella vexata]
MDNNKATLIFDSLRLLRLPSGSVIDLLAVMTVLYLLLLAVYRLYFSPSARFPGPRLAALSFWYEFYYDVWKEGQYTWKIRELHQEYGPFVRINPDEIHCNDPEFFDILYASSAKRKTDKWIWFVRQSWTRNSMFKTIKHDLHRQRRSQLSSFFSKSSIKTIEPLIVRKVNGLCARLEASSETQSVVSLTHAFVAVTLDIISRVCFGFSYDFLELPEFAQTWHDGLISTSRLGHSVRQFPWVFHLLSLFPRLLADPGILAANKRQEELTAQVAAVVDRHARGEKPPGEDGFTIFDAMLDADVPPEEKTNARLCEEAQALTAAGSLTTANTLDATIYQLLTHPNHLARLYRELEVAIPDPAVLPPATELEKLPFLTALLHEGLRISKGLPHRFARVSPDVSYSYGDVVIPRGLPVGMSFIDMVEDPETFPEPNSFEPERWMPFDEPEVRRRRKRLVIFGGGTRICLGINLAWAELYLTVAAVVRRFGDRLQLHDVVFERDLKIVVDGFNPLPSRESKGLRVVVRPKSEKGMGSA